MENKIISADKINSTAHGPRAAELLQLGAGGSNGIHQPVSLLFAIEPLYFYQFM